MSICISADLSGCRCTATVPLIITGQNALLRFAIMTDPSEVGGWQVLVVIGLKSIEPEDIVPMTVTTNSARRADLGNCRKKDYYCK